MPACITTELVIRALDSPLPRQLQQRRTHTPIESGVLHYTFTAHSELSARFRSTAHERRATSRKGQLLSLAIAKPDGSKPKDTRPPDTFPVSRLHCNSYASHHECRCLPDVKNGQRRSPTPLIQRHLQLPDNRTKGSPLRSYTWPHARSAPRLTPADRSITSP